MWLRGWSCLGAHSLLGAFLGLAITLEDRLHGLHNACGPKESIDSVKIEESLCNVN